MDDVEFKDLKVGVRYTVGTGDSKTTGTVTHLFKTNPFGYPKGPVVSIIDDADGRENNYAFAEYKFELAPPAPAPARAPAPAPARAPARAPDPSVDPWNEFPPPLPPGTRAPPRPPKQNVLSEDDIAEQKKFHVSLTPDEKEALSYYKCDGYEDVARYCLTQYDDPLNHDNKDLRGFMELVKKAPKLTQQINVFRGITLDDESALTMTGKMVMSTSYDPAVAFGFTEHGRNGCCMLKINVQPGVRIITFPGDLEHEIVIIPPYNASIEDIVPGLKRVTITPKEASSGGRRRKTNKGKRRIRKTRRRHK